MNPMQPAQPNQDEQFQQFLQSLSPDMIAQIMGAGTLDQQDQNTQQQMAQAHELRKQQAGAQPYGAGAGMASGLNGLLGGIQGGMLQNQQQENIGKRQGGIDALVAALRSGGGGI